MAQKAKSSHVDDIRVCSTRVFGGKIASVSFTVNFLSSFLVIVFLVSFSVFLVLAPWTLEKSNFVTGNAFSAIGILNVAPEINITNLQFLEGDFINISECAFDLNGEIPLCTFSSPLGHYNGSWQSEFGDAGAYVIEINATDGYGGFDTKNITIILFSQKVTGSCDIELEVLTDYNVNLTWNRTLKKNQFEMHNYTNFTMSYVDFFLNGTWSNYSASNITNIVEPHLYDFLSNNTAQRYYKLYAFNGLQEFECNTTYGKIEIPLTPDFGRWNYVSSPFIQKDTSLSNYVVQSEDEVEYAFKYNHVAGFFEFYAFSLSFGSFSDVDDGECLLLQPLNPTGSRIVLAGEVLPELSQNLTLAFDRWNYHGWVADNTTREKAFSGYESDLEFLFKYNHGIGAFDFHSFNLDFGFIDNVPQGSCNLIQPHNEIEYKYNIYD